MFCFFNHPSPTEIYTYFHTLSLHDALPIWPLRARPCRRSRLVHHDGQRHDPAAQPDHGRTAPRQGTGGDADEHGRLGDLSGVRFVHALYFPFVSSPSTAFAGAQDELRPVAEVETPLAMVQGRGASRLRSMRTGIEGRAS